MGDIGLLTPTPAKIETVPPHHHQIQLRLGLMLGTIAAILCLSTDASVVEQIDGLSLYMTYSEIAQDVVIALLIMLSIAAVWWLCVLLLVGIAHVFPAAKRNRESIAWYIAISVPSTYLVLNIFGMLKEQMFPRWHAGLFIWVAMFVLGVTALVVAGVSRLQQFSRTRLLPVFWVHAAIAMVALILLPARGIRLFHNYTHASGRGAASRLPDIYLITADALGTEDTSLYGYSRHTTPNLERFAQRSYTFDYFFSNSNFTAPATTSIETGKLPWTHRIFQQGGFLRNEARSHTLAELLHQRGYYTAMVTSNQWAAPFRHRTLDSYDAVDYVAPLTVSSAFFRYTNFIGANTQYTLYCALLKRFGRAMVYLDALLWPRSYPFPAEQVFDHARTILEQPDIQKPRFMWAHIFPPHDPYLPPAPYGKRFLSTDRFTRYADLLALRNDTLPPGASATELQARYDELVSYADQAIGNFLDWLDRTGRLENAIVVVSADHGESFHHRWFLHAGPELYNDVIHVPLLIHVPGRNGGKRISQLAQQADLLPTILDLIGGPVPNWADGKSLKPAMEGEGFPERFVFTMNLEPARIFSPISKGTLAVIDDEFKYVLRLDNQEGRLYRYKSDPLEQNNLIASNPEVGERLRGVLLNQLDVVNKRTSLTTFERAGKNPTN